MQFSKKDSTEHSRKSTMDLSKNKFDSSLFLFLSTKNITLTDGSFYKIIDSLILWENVYSFCKCLSCECWKNIKVETALR